MSDSRPRPHSLRVISRRTGGPKWARLGTCMFYRAMRAFPGEYLSLRLRAHELLHDVPLYDVSVVDLPGGGAGRSVADIRALESAAAPSRIANALYGVRRGLGNVFGWDQVPMRPEESLVSRLSERDRRDSEVTAGTPGWAVSLAVSVSR
jgi:hypothetical protein